MDMDKMMQAVVGSVVKDLTDQEVAALFMAMQLGSISERTIGYEKLERLRTGPDGSIHTTTMEALERYLMSRTQNFNNANA